MKTIRIVTLSLSLAASLLSFAAGLSINDDSFTYSGEYTDSESALQYLDARYYRPKLMRFASRDSYDLMNRYAYADGNPTMNEDPSGHFSLDPLSLASSAWEYASPFLPFYGTYEDIKNHDTTDPSFVVNTALDALTVLGPSIRYTASAISEAKATYAQLDDFGKFVADRTIPDDAETEKLSALVSTPIPGNGLANKLSTPGTYFSHVHVMPVKVEADKTFIDFSRIQTDNFGVNRYGKAGPMSWFGGEPKNAMSEKVFSQRTRNYKIIGKPFRTSTFNRLVEASGVPEKRTYSYLASKKNAANLDTRSAKVRNCQFYFIELMDAARAI